MIEVTTLTAKSLRLTVNRQEYATEEQISDAKFLVDQLDLMTQNEKLISYSGWKSEKVMAVEGLYKEWLILHKVYGDKFALAPNKALDEYWHYHILDTQKYMVDCENIFGYYLHHYPYFGLTEAEPAQDLEKGFLLTQELFKKHFGHTLTGLANPCAATRCR
ncbi:MAG: hypothetical protein Q9M28_00895 [Mariprofundaceae bacterium]|nr:hypothetical protein [Mariprofundaceae bacterium]